MTILKAVNRLAWRFGQNKSFLPNDLDIEALNEIIKFVNNTNKEAVAHNQGFAKLYIMFYAQMIEKYKSDIFDPIPQKELSRLLDMPLSYFFGRFTKKLVESDRYEILGEVEEERGDFMMQTEPQRQESIEKLKKLLENPEGRDKLAGVTWDEDEVSDNLLAMISAAVIKYNAK